MAVVDGLLDALIANNQESLLLTPGRPPRFRSNDATTDVSSQPLDGASIASLLQEAAGVGEPPATEIGSRWRFVYAYNGKNFDFSAASTPEGWSAAATLQTAKPAAAAPAVQAAPRPAAQAAAPPAVQAAAQPAPVARPAAPARTTLPSLDQLLATMLERGASDLHLSAGQKPRLRIDGSLCEVLEWSIPESGQLMDSLSKVMPPAAIASFEADNDADCAHEIASLGRFRINVFRGRLGVGAVFRHIPLEIPSFDGLGLPEILRSFTGLHKGLVLVTGPTGSGKSTTLAAMVDLINQTREDHLITIEDPIEFVHASRKCLVTQREVGAHTNSFHQALRAALREDPDIVLVGEMRDLETVSTAIQTAETGHLVFGTLHTTTAPGTVERLIGQFPADEQAQVRMMLAESLRAVVSQTLLKKIGGGRVAAFEILIATPAVSNLIREGKTFQIASAMQTGKEVGMTTLSDALVKLVKDKVVEPREAYNKAVFKDTLKAKLREAGIQIDG